MRKKNFGKDVRISWLTVMVIMIFTPADIFVTDVSGISSALCPPCHNWNGIRCAKPEGCICCFGDVCCWSNLCQDCRGVPPLRSCVSICDPDQCQGCVNGGCTSEGCFQDSEEFDETGGILCACECGFCEPPGSIFYVYFCSGQCYGNCYCEVTWSWQIIAQDPICKDITEEPGCVDTSDCKFNGWHLWNEPAPTICNCFSL